MSVTTSMLPRVTMPKKTRNVVITGSSKGLGKALAKKFFIDGNNVIINSRSKSNTLSTYFEFKQLSDSNPNCGEVYPINADIRSYEDCERLINWSVEKLGHIDIWINNSGVSTKNKLINLEQTEIDSIIDTNLKGTIYCCNLLIPILTEQQHKSIIINVEGAGSNLFATPDYSVYGCTKSGITQFTRTLKKEYANSNILFCTLSPGMVITDLLLSNCTTEMKTAFNIFGEKPETVAEFSINEIYNLKTNKNVRYLTIQRILILMCVYMFKRHRHFDKNGKLKM